MFSGWQQLPTRAGRSYQLRWTSGPDGSCRSGCAKRPVCSAP